MCKICLRVHFENSGDTNRHFADRFVPDTIIPSIMARSQQKLPLLPFPPPGISPSFHHPPRVLPRESKVDRSWHNSAYTLKEATSTSIENKWTFVCVRARVRACVCVCYGIAPFSTFTDRFHLFSAPPLRQCALLWTAVCSRAATKGNPLRGVGMLVVWPCRSSLFRIIPANTQTRTVRIIVYGLVQILEKAPDTD